jgi:hypothetical protein
LPPAWRQALTGPRFTVGGVNAWPGAIAKDGTMIAESKDADGAHRTTLIARDGKRTLLLRLPRSAHRTVSGDDTDGRYALLNVNPGDDPEHPTDEILLVDPRTGTRRNLLAKAPAPAGYVVAWRGAVLQAGVVYWGMTEPGEHPRHGIVLAYDVARRHYRVLARLAAMPLVQRDPRGVHWQGGLLAAAGVPSDVPAAPLSTDWRQNVVSDGTAFAWPGRTDAADAHVVYWLQGSRRHHWLVRAHGHHDPFMVTAVAGPFVFGRFSSGPVYVVDVRTGALASLSSLAEFGPTVGGHTAYFSSYGADHRAATVRIDTSGLPELRC